MTDKPKKKRATAAELAEELDSVKKEIAELRDEVQRGLRFCHVVMTNNTALAKDATHTVNGLGHALASDGSIDTNAVIRARDAYWQRSKPPEVRATLAAAVDKYDETQPTAKIDCASRLHLCRAACCRLGYVLSNQDLGEGVIKWDYGQPYLIKRDVDGWCVHLNSGCQCSVYAQRPMTCRGYDCRQNGEIWVDFTQGIVHPRVAQLPPVQRPAST